MLRRTAFGHHDPAAAAEDDVLLARLDLDLVRAAVPILVAGLDAEQVVGGDLVRMRSNAYSPLPTCTLNSAPPASPEN